MTLVLRRCRERKVMTFVFANDIEYAKPLIESGWDMIAVGTDVGWFSSVAAEVRKKTGH
jgi:4-hydroxy-2-oxoheptanedioate aldolase